MTHPLPIEPELATEALCADRATGLAVQAQYDREHGLPRKCMCADGSEPPEGVPCMLEHCHAVKPIIGKDGKPVAWVHPRPHATLPPAVAAKVQIKTRTEIAQLVEQNKPEPPDVVVGNEVGEHA